jgi:hypothetical protein
LRLQEAGGVSKFFSLNKYRIPYNVAHNETFSPVLSM